jgi:hypothetical protein
MRAVRVGRFLLLVLVLVLVLVLRYVCVYEIS